ncbi:MAG: SpoIIE family protein phosphatase [Flammeovirgaceae bacterium]
MELSAKSDTAQARINILKNVNIFSGVDDDTLYKIAAALKPINFNKDKDVFRKGDQGTSMYIIVKGKVSVHDGMGYVFGHLKEGQVFGEYALLDTEARSATITAVEQTVALMLDQDIFYGILGDNIEVVKGLLKVFTSRLRSHNTLQEDLVQSNNMIKLQKQEIEEQNELLAYKNRKITASINYAKRIQGVMLPTKQEVAQIFEQLFILYKPRDIVSGDFYWFTQKNNKYYFAVSDCTGHGVPGALMTMTGAMLLNHAVKEKGLEKVEDILQELHLGVANLLQAKDSNVSDGMDIALCCIDVEHQHIIYAGAKQPLWYVLNNKMHVIKPNREPIGGKAYEYFRSYKSHRIPLDKSAVYYMFTDGYQDQFNRHGKKFLRKKFRELLLDIHHRPLTEQHEILNNTIEDWKKEVAQTDDILVVGFRV